MDKLRKFFSKEDEPVRRYLYSVLSAALLLAVTFGLLSSEYAAALTMFVGVALLIPGVEVVRSKVSPAKAEPVEPEPERWLNLDALDGE